MSTLDTGDEPAERSPVGDDRSQPLVGTVVDARYRVVELIGGGGMGSVFRVQHLRLRKHFALKLLRPGLCDEPGMVQRFERESRLAASVRSEHVVGIVDSGSLGDGTPYFVMELGESDVRRLLRAEGKLAPMRAANLGIDTCRGLSAAHANDLVHRDLKPENLLLLIGDDGREIAKIADFGVAKSLDAGSTRRGTLVGTVRYMAPEQIGLDSPVGPAADIYALGVILYECLTGAVPFEEESTERTLYRIMTDTPEPLRRRSPELPRGLAEAIDRALQREPSARHASARAFAEALLPFAGVQRAQATSGRIVTSAPAMRSDGDTMPGSDDESGRAAPGSRPAGVPLRPSARTRPWLLAVVAGTAAFAAGRSWAPKGGPEDTAPRVASAPFTVTGEPPSRPSAVPTAARIAGPTSAAVPAAPPDPTRPAARATPAFVRDEAAKTRQPPTLSFDPRNPYDP